MNRVSHHYVTYLSLKRGENEVNRREMRRANSASLRDGIQPFDDFLAEAT